MTTPFPFVSGQVLTAAQLNDIQNLPISDKTASYTLLVGDVTKRTIMNSASATTITVDDAIFTVGDVIQVANKGAGTCTITAGAGVTINTSGSLALAQYGGGYLLCLSASTFTFFNLGGGRAVMTSKKISKAKRQIGDQTTKGGVIGIMIYALSTNNVDPVLIGLLVPVASSVLAWINKNRRPRPSVPIHTKRRRQTKKLTRPYTVSKQPVVTAPLAGMATWVRLCCKHSDGSLWNNGIFVNRDMRNKPGIISNHARGLATDLSYRWQPPKRGRQDGRKVSLAYVNKLLQNADTLGIELVIDYAQSRSWRCDRGTWQIGKFRQATGIT
jgi:hypothetical protein